jgi:hypothetical protein
MRIGFPCIQSPKTVIANAWGSAEMQIFLKH